MVKKLIDRPYFFQNNIDLNKIKLETLPVDLKNNDIEINMVKEDKEEFKGKTTLNAYINDAEDKIETVNNNYVKYNEEMEKNIMIKEASENSCFSYYLHLCYSFICKERDKLMNKFK